MLDSRLNHHLPPHGRSEGVVGPGDQHLVCQRLAHTDTAFKVQTVADINITIVEWTSKVKRHVE